MKQSCYSLAAMVLLLGAGICRGESVVAPIFDDQGRLALIHLMPLPGGSWQTEELPLPTLQGLEPNLVDAAAGKFVLSAVKTVRPDSGVTAEGQTMTWLSACYDLNNLVEVLRAEDYLVELSADCPYNSHTLAALRRNLLAEVRKSAPEPADLQALKNLYSTNPPNLFGLFGSRSQPFATVSVELPKASDPAPFRQQLYLADFETAEITLVAETTEGTYSLVDDVREGRYISYVREDRALVEAMWSAGNSTFDWLNTGKKAFIYDATTRQHVFESPAVYKGTEVRTPRINRQGSHVIFPRTEAPNDRSDPSVLDGPLFLELYDLAEGTSRRVTTGEDSSFFIDWLPDGSSFLFGTYTRPPADSQVVPIYFIEAVDGTRTPIDWKVEGISEPLGALTAGVNRSVWLASGRQFVTLMPEFLGRNESGTRYGMKAVLTDIDAENITVIAEYEFVEKVRLNGRESMPIYIP